MPIFRLICLTLLLLIANSLAHVALGKQSNFFFTRQLGYEEHSQGPVPAQLTVGKPPKKALKGALPIAPNKPDASDYALHRRRLLQQEPVHTQRAWLYSTVLPGLGQAYNHSYWKIYLIYGVFAGLTWLAVYNHQEYQVSKRELIQVPQSGSLANYVQSRKRDRNLFVIIAGLWYVINIFDAYVDGTLKTFDISDNLEVIIQPTSSATTNHHTALGFGISVSLKP